MKRALLIAAFVAAPAFADNEMSYMPNKAGGNIFFTYSRCVYVDTQKPIPKNFYMYSTDEYGNKLADGCYEYKPPFYMVKWNSGTRTSIPVSQITLLK